MGAPFQIWNIKIHNELQKPDWKFAEAKKLYPSLTQQEPKILLPPNASFLLKLCRHIVPTGLHVCEMEYRQIGSYELKVCMKCGRLYVGEVYALGETQEWWFMGWVSDIFNSTFNSIQK